MVSKRTEKKTGGPTSIDWRDEDARKVIIEFGTPQWWAWDRYTRKTANPNGLPHTKFDNGKVGWRCLGNWPPGDLRRTSP
jgi:hypothetical protein